MTTPSAALGNRTPEQLKVAELREELKKRGIQIKGLKKDLVDRLEEVLKQEELEQQKALETVVEDAVATPAEADQPDPVTPVTKRRSKGHAKEDVSKDVFVSDEPVLASEGTEITVSVVEESKSREGDTVPEAAAEIVTAATPVEETTIIAGNDNVGEELPVVESAKAVDDQATTTPAVPALEDLVADLEHNFNKVVEEEPQVQQVEETGTIEGQPLSEKSTDIVPAIEPAVVETVAVTEEEVISTTSERTVTVEEQDVATVPADQNIATMEAEQTVTTSTRVETEATEESASEVTTMEETTTAVMTFETTITVAYGEGLKLDTGAVGVLEGESDEKIDEAPKEDVTGVVIVAETPKVEIAMDVDGGAEKGSSLEEPKEETPMDVDADTQKGSKRKDAAVDGEFATLEPTKRRRWNSAKGEEESKTSGKEVQPLELHEPVLSPNAPVPSAKVSTPKSALPEKVAVTRTAPTRTEAAVNGEGQKTRVVPPSAKPPTTSLKIDKFLRPFTFKAVTELLAQTGTVQDVWMDQIKTHCYVTYSSEEEATATRNALYNLQWPPQGGRLLTAEFVDPSEVKLRSDGEKAAAAAGPTATTTPSTNAITPRGALSANSKASKDGVTAAASGHPSSAAAGLLPPPPPVSFPPRDRPKQEVESTPTLDDLFRKTRSKPHIYYLPLTAQEVADKVAARNRGAATKPGVRA